MVKLLCPTRLVLVLSSMFLLLPAHGEQPNGPQIGDINWYLADSYCNFFRTGHTFEYDDPASWQFVFLTSLVSDSKITSERGYARINGVLRELELVERTLTDFGERRLYRTYGDAPVTLTVTMHTGEKGSEHTNYTGTINAQGPGGQTSVSFAGDCGV